VVCVTAALLATVWTPFFVDFDEAVLAEVARDMWESGRWLAPMWNGAPYLDKPLLFYWIAEGLYRLLGVSPFAVRLISIVSTVGLLSFVGSTLVRRATPVAAEAAVWVAGASLLPFSLGRLGLLDAALTASMTIALVSFYIALGTGAARNRRRRLTVGYLATGLALAVKGPVFPLLVGSVLLADAVRRRDVKNTLNRSGMVWGVPLLLLVGLPSNLPILLSKSGAGGFLLEHNVMRALAPMQGHSGGPLYYVPVLAIALLPFSALAAGALVSFRHNGEGTAQLARFCVVWAVTVTIAFTIAATKLPHYVAPALPPLAILVGLETERVGRGRRGAWIGTVTLAGLFGALLAALPWVVASAPHLADAKTLAKVPEIAFVPDGVGSRIAMGGIGVGFLVAAAYAAKAAGRGEQLRAVRRLGVAACVLWSAVWLGLGHAASVAWQQPLRRLSQAADADLPKGDPIVLVEMNHRVTPTLVTGRGVVFLRARTAEQVAELRRRLEDRPAVRVVMPLPIWSELRSRVEGRELLRDGPYVLIGSETPPGDAGVIPPAE